MIVTAFDFFCTTFSTSQLSSFRFSTVGRRCGAEVWVAGNKNARTQRLGALLARADVLAAVALIYSGASRRASALLPASPPFIAQHFWLPSACRNHTMMIMLVQYLVLPVDGTWDEEGSKAQS